MLLTLATRRPRALSTVVPSGVFHSATLVLAGCCCRVSQLLLLLLVPFPHELLAALIAQDDLDQRELVLAVLRVCERQLKRLERGAGIIRVDITCRVQRAARVAARRR